MKPIALAALLASACFVPPVSDKENLKDQARTFNDYLRWRRYGDAAMLLPPGDRPRFLARARDVADDFEVADYEVVSTAPAAQGMVEVRVGFDWESKRTGLLRHTEVAELWGRVGKEWVLAAVRQLRGEPVPLLGGDGAEGSEK